jgi:hypothetical protein
MKTTHSLTPRFSGLFALLAVVPSFVAAACGGSSNSKAPGGPSGKAGSSTAGSSGSNATGGSGGGSSGRGGTNTGDSGKGGTASGGTGGSGGGTTADDGGQGGESSGSGGTGGSSGGVANGGAGQGGSAGQAGAAGQSGSAGSGTAGMVGVLGTPCSPPGSLACAGNYQKLTVLCNGDGEWEPNETCGTDLVCDSTPGPNVGTCQPVAAECEAGPGTTFCSADESSRVICGPDAVNMTEEACDGACHRAVCRDDREACPNWEDYEERGVACATDCGKLAPPLVNACVVNDLGCYVAIVNELPALVRAPWTDDTCACEMVEGRTMRVDVDRTENRRITVSPPWSIGSCGQAPQRCALLPSVQQEVELWTPETDSGPVNILIEHVSQTDSCPE